MTIRPILLHPDPRLKKAAAPVGTVTPEIEALVADMFETMYDAPGIGLAAPQIGVSRRVIVMDCAGKEETSQPLVMVDPQIVAASEETNTHEEGCLSIPEHFADVTRPAEVTVRWTALDGTAREARFEGLWATCVQHEIDHLDGKLFIDHIGPLRRQMITRKMTKLKRERARA